MKFIKPETSICIPNEILAFIVNLILGVGKCHKGEGGGWEVLRSRIRFSSRGVSRDAKIIKSSYFFFFTKGHSKYNDDAPPAKRREPIFIKLDMNENQKLLSRV